MNIRTPLPPDPERMNDSRAEWAKKTIEFFEFYGERPHPDSSEDQIRYLLEQNLSDLVADFAHLCDRSGIEMRNVMRKAIGQYREETDDLGYQF